MGLEKINIDWAKYRKFLARLAEERIAQEGQGHRDPTEERQEQSNVSEGGRNSVLDPSLAAHSSDMGLARWERALSYAMMEGGRQIFRRMQLRSNIEAWKAQSGGKEKIQEAVSEFAMGATQAWPFGFVSEPRRQGESATVQYLRGHHVKALADHFEDETRRFEVANSFPKADAQSLIEGGQIFLVVDARANDKQIKEAIVRILRYARRDFGIERGSLPSVGDGEKRLRTLEEILAIFDWHLFRDFLVGVDSFEKFVAAVLGSSEKLDADVRRMRSLWRDNEKKVLNFDYAIYLQRQGLI